MKKLNLIIVALMLFVGSNVMAQTKTKPAAKTFNAKDYAAFGEKFKVGKVLTKEQMLKKYKNLKKGDTITVQFESKIKSVCKKK